MVKEAVAELVADSLDEPVAEAEKDAVAEWVDDFVAEPVADCV